MKRIKAGEKAIGVPTKQRNGGAKTTRTGTKKVRTVSAGQVTRVSMAAETQVAVTGDLFDGANSIEMTSNTITVTHGATKTRNGVREKIELRRRLPQTEETMAALGAAIDSANQKRSVKRIRIDFKN